LTDFETDRFDRLTDFENFRIRPTSNRNKSTMACCAFCRSIKFRIAMASIGVFVGILAGVWFAWEFHSYNSATFALISAVFATLVLVLHIKYKNGTLYRWTPRLRCLSVLGCLGQLLGFTAFVTYIVLAIVEKQDLSVVGGENYWVSLVWGWMTWKWGFGLFWYAREYKKEFQLEALGLRKCEDGVKDSGTMGNPAATTDGELIE
jgi:hypothetical protein